MNKRDMKHTQQFYRKIKKKNFQSALIRGIYVQCTPSMMIKL